MGPAPSLPVPSLLKTITQSEYDDLNNKINTLTNDKNTLTNENTTLTNKISGKLKDSNGNIINSPSDSSLTVTSPKPMYSDQSGLQSLSQALTTNVTNYYNLLQTDENIIHNQLEPQIDILKKIEFNGIDIAFTTIKKQNTLIENKINNLKENYSTDNQKVRYQAEKIISTRGMNFILYILYFVLFFVLLFVFIFKNTTLSFYPKIYIILAFFLYPFLIDPLEQFLIFLWKYIFAMINGNVYTSNNY